MYEDKKEIEIKTIFKYQYESDLENLKEIIKELTDIKGLKSLEVKNEN